jgi:hypothetical protein
MLDVTLAAPQRHENLTVFPLVARGPAELPYELMADAINAGSLRITEVGSGSVPELYAIHQGDVSILVLDGEQLIGARQNRMTNRSILLPAHAKTSIPVSCMEQGRWRPDSDRFDPAPQNAPSTVRRRTRDREALNVNAGRAAGADTLREAQGDVWGAIADKSAAIGFNSPTSALNDLYTDRTADVSRFLAAFPVVDGQVGLVAYLGDTPLGLDLIGSTRIYGRVHGRLMRGYVMDAVGEASAAAELAESVAQGYLDSVTEARRVDSPTVGLGTYRVLTGAVVGGELKAEDRLVHLSAFPAEARGDGGGLHSPQPLVDPIAPPSRRRGRRR